MIKREDIGDVTVLRLAHGKVNALDLELLDAIVAAFGEVRARPVVLTGSGRAFSAGVDLTRIVDGGADYVTRYLPALSAAFMAVFEHPAPTVAAVNGHAIAGGTVLVAACDRRLGADAPLRLGLTELAVGVAFPVVPLEIVRHAIGPAAARLVLGADLISAQDALTLRLLEELVAPEELEGRAVAEATRLAALPGDVYAFSKLQLHRPALAAMAAAAGQDHYVEQIWSGHDGLGRIAAFMQGLVMHVHSRSRPSPESLCE